MTPAEIATAFIASHEGFRAAPYRDTAGVWTQGYGFTYTEDGKPVTADTPHTTEEAARQRLTGMVARVMASVRTMVCVPVTDNQLSALTSFAFNLGTHALRNSKLLAALNQGRPAEAATHFGEWVYAGGKYSPGLAARRAEERALFLRVDAPTETTALTLEEQASYHKALAASVQFVDPDHSADALMAAEQERLG